ncbi:sigma-70 family RNA polymerase sigma factor [Saccharopolyspora sp. HNM0983]|uniref:Sigma-70 family RNA polymerase sigma factor n=1 Tax=Saccharopolyspora montiporae TaxID=2781240 RepID=A0A929BBR1_9PSEU|nr:sigma-70 family RNA polymerase sigma factor [Saccharopolyspora sp. HNM0983]MBE9375840.1 sigma-70 family RNA polymerase sigma factor [Saccharopolyspora sp. HNM0983]
MPGADEELAERVHGGSDAAFALLYDRHVHAARRLAATLAVPPTDPEDLVSEAFSRLLGALRRRRVLHFRAYLNTTMRNLAADTCRQQDRYRLVADMTAVPHPSMVVPFTDPVVRRIDRAEVGDAFGALPKRWQAVLWWLEVEGVSTGAVAETTGMSAAGVSALAYRARNGLRAAYARCERRPAVHPGRDRPRSRRPADAQAMTTCRR